MSQVCALWNLGSKGQRSRSQCKDYWKWFLAHNCFPFSPFFMKLHMQSPHESSMDPMDFGVKGQGHNARITEKGFWRITASLYTYLYENSHAFSPWVEYGPMNFGVKGQGHNARISEEGFWRITASPIWCITWRVWIGCRGGYFVPLGQPHSSSKLFLLIWTDFNPHAPMILKMQAKC